MSEELRLRIVKQFERLNLKHDQVLRQAVSYAAKLCSSPVSSITLLDKDTQWIKVNKGLDIEQMPREFSFCDDVIRNSHLLVISDLLDDERFCTNPYVTGEPKIRFYAGMPLITHDGHRVGTLCVMDYKPHVLTGQQKLILKILAKHAMSVMELKLSFDQLYRSTAALKQIRGKQANNELKLRSMFESLTDAYFLFGKAGEIIDFNRAAYNFVKDMYGEKLTYGRVMTDFLIQVNRDVFTVNYQQALNGEKVQIEMLLDSGLEKQTWWDCVFEPVRHDNGEIFGVSYVTRNIDERKMHEERIIAQNQLLSRIAEIQSHDYRGPLTSILGLMNLIEEEGYTASKEYLIMLHQAFKKLDEKIHEVVHVINDPVVY